MCNDCQNDITIIGDKNKIKEIIKKIGSIPFSLKLVLFETLIGNDPEIDKIGRYESNMKHFGTKWDVCTNDCNIKFSENKITMSMVTPGCPPVPFCITLAKEYGVKVKIIYSEPVNDFAGYNIINETGDVIEEQDYDYKEGIYYLHMEKCLT